MKKKITLFAFIVMALAVPQVASAYDFSAVAPSGQTLYYNIVNGNAAVTYLGVSYNSPYGGYTKPEGVLTIPATVTNSGTTYSVTKIGEYAFDGCSGLTTPNTYW